jgi:diguanylate cyclase (GGDEF)-like protein
MPAVVSKFLAVTQTIMMNTIKRVLAPPVFPGDEEKTRRASFLNEFIGINLLFGALITVAVLLGNNVSTKSQIIVMLWLVLLALGWLILHRGRVALVAFTLSAICFVFLTGASISLGTVRTPTTALYVIWILVVGILFQLPGILMAASASSLAVLGLILAENAGLLPQPNYSVGVTQWLNYTALFGMTAGMIYYGNRVTRNALVRAKNEIEQRKRAEEAAEASALQIKRAEALLRTAIETINEAFVIFDSNDCLVFCNEKYRQVYAESAHLMVPGVSFETLIRNSAKQGRYLAAVGRVEEWVSERLDAHRASVGTSIMEKHANGDTLRTVERRTPDGCIVGFRVDVTELQQAKQELQEKHDELESIANYDTLTKLPNRAMLTDRMRQALSQSRRSGQQVGVVFLDLDGFKAVNDTHGHDAGDHLLITVAERMKLALREGDTLARLGGDEFVAMLPGLTDADASAPILNRLLAAAAQPVQFGDAVPQVSASLGVTFYPQAQEIDADQLLRQADQAMYQAKQTGKNRYAVFNAAQDRLVREHQTLRS